MWRTCGGCPGSCRSIRIPFQPGRQCEGRARAARGARCAASHARLCSSARGSSSASSTPHLVPQDEVLVDHLDGIADAQGPAGAAVRKGKGGRPPRGRRGPGWHRPRWTGRQRARRAAPPPSCWQALLPWRVVRRGGSPAPAASVHAPGWLAGWARDPAPHRTPCACSSAGPAARAARSPGDALVPRQDDGGETAIPKAPDDVEIGHREVEPARPRLSRGGCLSRDTGGARRGAGSRGVGLRSNAPGVT